MKTVNLMWLGLVAFLAVPVCAADSPVAAASVAPPAPVAPAPIQPALSVNAAEVVKLFGAGVGDEVILAYVKNCQSPFDLSADSILRLKQAGVTSPVIAAMLAQDSSLRNQKPTESYAQGQRLYAPAQPTPVVAATSAQTVPQPATTEPSTTGANASNAQPAPATIQPAPTYVQTAPVYVQPSPVYVYPAPSYGYYDYSPYYGYPALSLSFGFGGGYYGGYHGGGGGGHGGGGHR